MVTRPAKIAIEAVSKTFDTKRGRPHLAVSDISLDVSEGEFVSVLGPSGCGKSTLLYIVGGFVAPSTGSVTVGGRPVTGPGPDRGPVFQEFALFPWKTVLGNVMYGLSNRASRRREAQARVRELLAMVHLSGYESFYPKELSGGMKQRVAIARTLAYQPNILLMDEPFGALDAHTRTRLQNDLLAIWERDRKTVLFVTHSVEEAVFLSDRVVDDHALARPHEGDHTDRAAAAARARHAAGRSPLPGIRGQHRAADGRARSREQADGAHHVDPRLCRRSWPASALLAIWEMCGAAARGQRAAARLGVRCARFPRS